MVRRGRPPVARRRNGRFSDRGARRLDYLELLSGLFLDYGYLAVFLVLLLCGLGLPLPEEVTLIAAGLVVFEGKANLHLMVLVTVLGILGGDSLLFALGWRFGPPLLTRPFFRRLLHADRMAKVRRQFDRHGVKAVFFARFFAGIRACVYFTAGTLGMRYRTFILLDLCGALLSAPISVWLGMHFGASIEGALKYLSRFDRAILAVVLVLILGSVLRSHRRRRSGR